MKVKMPVVKSRAHRLLALAVAIVVPLSMAACHLRQSPEEKTEWMTHIIAKRLDLNEQQKAKLDAVRDEVLRSWKETRDERRAVIDDLIAQVSKDQMNQAHLLQLFERKQGLFRQAVPGVIAKAADFHATLTREQKVKAEELLKRLKEKMTEQDPAAKM